MLWIIPLVPGLRYSQLLWCWNIFNLFIPQCTYIEVDQVGHFWVNCSWTVWFQEWYVKVYARFLVQFLFTKCNGSWSWPCKVDHTLGFWFNIFLKNAKWFIKVDHTLGVILSKPAWMWGAEMGANEVQLIFIIISDILIFISDILHRNLSSSSYLIF